jgi:thioredoxin 1
MASFFRDNWQTLGMVVLAGGLVALSLCRGSTGCFLMPGRSQGPGEPAAATASPLALTPNPRQEKTMSTGYVQGTVLHANEANFDQQVLAADVPVLVDFYADWCGPCRMIAPVLEELARETPAARIVKVNVDENPALASRYGISSIPSLLVFKNGEICWKADAAARSTKDARDPRRPPRLPPGRDRRSGSS